MSKSKPDKKTKLSLHIENELNKLYNTNNYGKLNPKRLSEIFIDDSEIRNFLYTLYDNLVVASEKDGADLSITRFIRTLLVTPTNIKVDDIPEIWYPHVSKFIELMLVTLYYNDRSDKNRNASYHKRMLIDYVSNLGRLHRKISTSSVVEVIRKYSDA